MPRARTLLYVGSYTNESPVGIRVYDASDVAGRLVELSQFDGVAHPSFLAVHPSGEVVYAVSETAPPEGGELVALRADTADGSLRVLDRVSSHGSAPCYVSVDPAGRYVYVANYLSGTVAAYALDRSGRIGQLIATQQHTGSGPHVRQQGPHAHCIVPGPVDDFVYAVDLGTDRVSHYVHDRRLGPEEFRHEADLVLDAGAGPRHLVFHPTAHVGFVVCELDSTISMLGLDPTNGRLTRLGSYGTLPDDFVGESTAAEVRVHPNGRHVYVSNRGHDSIAVFDFAGAGEQLVPLGHVSSGGRTPRNFAVHPSGSALLVANQDSNSIVAFGIDSQSGVPLQLDIEYAVSEPVCLTYSEVAA
jgi:6-phosphogluconolactonase